MVVLRQDVSGVRAAQLGVLVQRKGGGLPAAPLLRLALLFFAPALEVVGVHDQQDRRHRRQHQRQAAERDAGRGHAAAAAGAGLDVDLGDDAQDQARDRQRAADDP